MMTGNEQPTHKMTKPELLQKNHAVYWSDQDSLLYIALQDKSYEDVRLNFKQLYQTKKASTQEKSNTRKKSYHSYPTEKYLVVEGLTKEIFTKLDFTQQIKNEDWDPKNNLQDERYYTDVIKKNKQPYWDEETRTLFILRDKDEDPQKLVKMLGTTFRPYAKKKKFSCHQSLDNRIVIEGLDSNDLSRIFEKIPMIAERKWVNESSENSRAKLFANYKPYTDGTTPNSVYIILENTDKDMNTTTASRLEKYFDRNLKPKKVIKKRKTYDNKIYLFLLNISDNEINNQFGTSATLLSLPEKMKVDLSASFKLFPDTSDFTHETLSLAPPSPLQSGTSLFGSWPASQTRDEKEDNFKNHLGT